MWGLFNMDTTKGTIIVYKSNDEKIYKLNQLKH